MKNQCKSIKIFRDKYFLRKTFDIVNYFGGIEGYDIYDKDEFFLIHYDIPSIRKVVSNLKFDVYQQYK